MRSLLAASVAAAALIAPAAAAAHQPAVAVTKISAIGKTNSGTGDTAAPAINARVVTVDNGVTINSTGSGTGFRKEGLYVSVLYENGSKSTGPGACLPAGKVNFPDRIIGAWIPNGATTRVLAPVTQLGNAYSGSMGQNTGAAISGSWDHGTISIRRVDLIKPPMLYANLQACGRVGAFSPTAGTLWSTSLSSVFSAPFNSGSIYVDPFTSATQVPAPTPKVRTVVKTITKTVTVAAPTRTVTVPTTITTPPITISVPSVTTVTIPGLPPLRR